MATKYPNGIDDNISLPQAIDLITPVKAEVVNRIRGGLLAVEAELGVDPSAQFSTVRARLDYLEANKGINSVKQDGTIVVSPVVSLNFTGNVNVTDAGSCQATIEILGGADAEQESFAATVGQTDFTLSETPNDPTTVMMFINGTKYEYGVDYVVVGTDVSYIGTDYTIEANDIVEFWYLINGDGGGGGGGGENQTLAQTLSFGNVTGGTGIVITAGDSISGSAGTVLIDDALVITGNISNTGGDVTVNDNLTVNGKLTVTGIIDPTGLVLDEQATVPGGTPASNKGTFWIRNDGYGIITDDTGTDYVLSFSGNDIQSLSEVLTQGNLSGGTNIVISSGDSIVGEDEGNLVLRGGDSVGGNSGNVNISTGDITIPGAVVSGEISINTGDITVGGADETGGITISTGSATNTSTTGAIVLETGSVSGGGDIGSLTIRTGSNASGSGNSGDLNIIGGIANTGSAINITAGDGTNIGGGVSIASGSGAFSAGSVTIDAGDASAGAGGDITLATGVGTGATSGILTLRSGNSSGSDNSGPISLRSGNTDDGNSGDISINSGEPLGNGDSGGIAIYTSSTTFGSGASGGLSIYTGAATDDSGAISLYTGNSSANPGDITVDSGDATVSGFDAGNIIFSGGNQTSGGTGNAGRVQFIGGDSSGSGDGGGATFSGGSSSSGGGGDIGLIGGEGATGGGISITSGAGTAGDGGLISIISGNGSVAGGDVVISAGIGSTSSGSNIITIGSNNDHVIIGDGAMALTSSFSTSTVAIGPNAAKGINNDAFGVWIGGSVGPQTLTTVGGDNIAVGRSSLAVADAGTQNSIAIGASVGGFIGFDQPWDDGNIAIGSEALQVDDGNTPDVNYNIAIGDRAANSITAAGVGNLEYNVLLGYQAGNAATINDYNVLLGFNVASAATGTNDNIAIGRESVSSASSLTNTVYIGARTGVANSAAGNVGIGHRVGESGFTGANNTVIGFEAASTAVLGSNNVIIGASNAQSCSGQSNIVIGTSTASSLSSGDYNVVMSAVPNQVPLGNGNYNLVLCTTPSAGNLSAGSFNTVIGAAFGSGAGLTSGENNTLIDSSGSTLTTGSQNLLIGQASDAPASDTDNFVAITNLITGNVSAQKVAILRGTGDDLASQVEDFAVYGDGYVYGNFGITGKLSVDGLIDPTGLVLDVQSSVPGGTPAAGKSTLWIRDTDGYAILTDEFGNDVVIGTGATGGGGTTQDLANVLVVGNTSGGNDIIMSGSDDITRTGDSALTISSEDRTTGAISAEIIISTGAVNSTSDSSGGITIVSGDCTSAGGSSGFVTGPITIGSGNVTAGAKASGPVNISTGNSAAGTENTGSITFATGNETSGNPTLESGNISFSTGTAGNVRGNVTVSSHQFNVTTDDTVTFTSTGLISLLSDSYVDGDLEVSGNITVSDPIDPDHAATKAYVDNFPVSTLAEILAEGNDANSLNITNLANPVNAQDATTKSWVETQIATSTTKFVQEDLEVTSNGQTEFELSFTPDTAFDGYSVLMFINQLKIETDEFGISGTTVTYTGPLTLTPGTHTVGFYYPVNSSETTTPVFNNLLAGVSTNDSSGWKVVGMAEVDSREFSGDATFETILFTSDGYADGYARLFNATTAAQVGSELTTTSDEPVLLSTPIILDGGSNLYEIQIKTEQDGSGEFVSCGMGRIKVDTTLTNETVTHPIVSGVVTNDSNAWTDIGIVEIDPGEYVFNTATFEVLLSSTDGYTMDGYLVAEARLYNLTTQAQVGMDMISESNLAELVTQTITLDSGSNLYAVQLRLSEDGGDTDFATCSMARIKLE